MHKLIVILPVNRDFEGLLRLEDQNGRLVTGPFAVCGRADGEAAARHGNSPRHTLLPFGDTPLGRYRIAGILPTRGRPNLPGERFGPYGVVVLKPIAGDAALADANGRFHIVIQGGKLGPGRRLRPTNGSLRVADQDLKKLVHWLRRMQHCVCECVAAAEPVTCRTVARQGVSYEEADPPLSGPLASLSPATTSGRLGADQFSYESDQPRLFGPPPFHLFADSGGGSGGGGTGGGGVGGGYEPDVPPDAAVRDQQISDATSYLKEKAAPDYTGQSGQCAKFVGDAIRESGVQIMPIGGAGYAADMGPKLVQAGFTTVPNDSPHEDGDVAVIQPYPGQTPPTGHAAMWDGDQWVSDFKQGAGPSPDLPYPGPSYRTSAPPYTIYRWPAPKG
jgi:hypothetical protein